LKRGCCFCIAVFKAKQPDKSGHSYGRILNNDNLLVSKADQYSNLTEDLRQQKIEYGWRLSGREFNVFKDAASFCNGLHNWPTEIIFSGFEIGEKKIGCF